MIKKRREQCVVFLDDCLDSNSSFAILNAAGFVVERFTAHFPDERNPAKRKQDVKDPRVIRLCHQHGFLLVTTDREMRNTFVQELKKTDIGVLATANNSEGDDVWVKRISESKTKAAILRHFKKQERPYFSIIQRSGIITIETIGADRNTRRTRPQEQE